jgi:hypothetical protein
MTDEAWASLSLAPRWSPRATKKQTAQREQEG